MRLNDKIFCDAIFFVATKKIMNEFTLLFDLFYLNLLHRKFDSVGSIPICRITHLLFKNLKVN